MLFALDAGHGLHTPGKRTPDGIREWTLNSAVCKHIAEYLAAYDCEVMRTDDVTGASDIPLGERRSKAIHAGATVLVSVHHNAGGGTGTEVYAAASRHPDSARLSALIAPRLAKATGMRNRGAKRAGFVVINTAQIPAVLCEGGFMDHPDDTAYIRTEQGQKAYAKAVVDGLVEFFGIDRKQGEEEMKVYKYVPDMPAWAQDTFGRLVQAGCIAKGKDGAISVQESTLQPMVYLDRLTGGKIEKMAELMRVLEK